MMPCFHFDWSMMSLRWFNLQLVGLSGGVAFCFGGGYDQKWAIDITVGIDVFGVDTAQHYGGAFEHLLQRQAVDGHPEIKNFMPNAFPEFNIWFNRGLWGGSGFALNMEIGEPDLE